jgi:hypothetical protein
MEQESHIVISEDSEDSDSYESEVLDKTRQIIQKQIEHDLLTHDFTKPHVSRAEIQEIIGMKVKNISYYR